jgi:aspartyl-tRNA(Asn)/glutamyl-tRNA(Gln) amidotransferase subunit A
VGKANMDEFAMGSSCENSAFAVSRNPWDTDTVPGGSSGGSAAAVAAAEAVWALGSETGGSIRLPAAYCGVVGMKPTYGRVSRYGLVAYASSLDQIGPITRDVTDCALVMNAICGYDRADSTSINAPAPDYTKSLVPDVKGLRIGLPKEYFTAGMDPEVEKAIYQAIEQLKAMGAEYKEVSMPHTEYALAAYYMVATAEASSNLARYDGVGFGHRGEGNDIVAMYKKSRTQGFGEEVRRRIMLGTYALSSGYYDAYYLKALKVRTLIKQDFDKAFEQVDVLVTPIAPTPAFKIGEKTGDPLAMYLQDVCTVPINLAGVPAISLPCGFEGKLPIGLQIIGKPLGEETILRAAYAFEQANDYHTRLAPLGEA